MFVLLKSVMITGSLALNILSKREGLEGFAITSRNKLEYLKPKRYSLLTFGKSAMRHLVGKEI